MINTKISVNTFISPKSDTDSNLNYKQLTNNVTFAVAEDKIPRRRVQSRQLLHDDVLAAVPLVVVCTICLTLQIAAHILQLSEVRFDNN